MVNLKKKQESFPLQGFLGGCYVVISWTMRVGGIQVGSCYTDLGDGGASMIVTRQKILFYYYYTTYCKSKSETTQVPSHG